MGFLDKAKKLAQQALEKAEEAVADAGRQRGSAVEPTPAASEPTTYGTPYRPGMLGRPGWREMGLVDPAGILPLWERHKAGIPHDIKSTILDAGFGMGRRWSFGASSLGLFYQLYPDHEQWSPLAGRDSASLPDGTELELLARDGRRVVLEAKGIGPPALEGLRSVVAVKLSETG